MKINDILPMKGKLLVWSVNGYGIKRYIRTGPLAGSAHTDCITTRTAKALLKRGIVAVPEGTWNPDWTLSPAQDEKVFTVLARSSNTNSFGLRQFIVCRMDGEAWRIHKSSSCGPSEKEWEQGESFKVPVTGSDREPFWGRISVELAHRLSNVPVDILRELFRTLTPPPAPRFDALACDLAQVEVKLAAYAPNAPIHTTHTHP